MGADFEIVIVGGGIAGASVGAELASAGRKVVILETEEQCGLHSTGRSAAFYLESYGGPGVAPLTVASEEFLSAGGFLRRRGAIHLAQGEWPEVPEGVESRRLDLSQLEGLVPGLRPQWDHGLFEPGCADIDVAGLHSAYLRKFRRSGGQIRTDGGLSSARRSGDGWLVELADGTGLSTAVIVNAAGAWADEVALAAGVKPLGIAPKRRTMLQLRVGRSGLGDLPLVDDPPAATFYFKGEGDNRVWLSPHDEIDTEPCDAAPDEIDVALAIERFREVVDWPLEAVERKWAGLRSFAPDRVPVYGFDPNVPGFFWCAGQGGFGIQTAPAAARLAAAELLGQGPDPTVAHIDPAPYSPARFR